VSSCGRIRIALIAASIALLRLPSFGSDPVTAARFAVPVLCTPNPSARTRARGTAIVVDVSGVVVTAAHVVADSKSPCILTLLVPNDEWRRASGFRAFAIEPCVSNELLDVAVCRIHPLERPQDWSYLRAAPLRTQVRPSDVSLTVTGFTGWGIFPTVVRGHIVSPRQLYRREDGCYCDFAIDTATYQGMSGSPLVNERGEVIGLITIAGSGKFRGLSFGTSFERAATFLTRAGIRSIVESPQDRR